jgi:hypothetical protein
MSPSALERAKKTVSTEPADLATLSGTRLGLSVVGLLARKYGLTISFRPSARGGTGVVVMIPARLIVQPEQDTAPLESGFTAAGNRPAAAAHVPGGGRPDGVEKEPERGPEHGTGHGVEHGPEHATGHGPKDEPEDGAPDQPGEPDGLGELPKRLPGQTLREAETKTADTSRPPSARPPAADVGDRFKAFHQVFRQSGPGAGGGSPAPRATPSPDDGAG